MKNAKLLPFLLFAVLAFGMFTAAAQQDEETSAPGPGWLTAAAEALDMDPEAVMDALREGQTLAEMAEAQGVEVEALVDALVAAETDRLTESITEMVQGRSARLRAESFFFEGPPMMPIEAMPTMPFGREQAWLVAASQALEITDPAVLSTMMARGKSLADIADESEIEVEAVIEAIEAAAFEHIDTAVEAGQLSEERAENLKAYMSNVITEFVLNPSPMPFFQGGMGAMRGEFFQNQNMPFFQGGRGRMPGEFFQNMPFFEHMPRGRGK